MRSFLQTFRSVLTTTILLPIVPLVTSEGTEYTRVTGEGATGDWTDLTKWNPNTGFPGTVNDWAIFNTGATQRTISLDAAQTIGMLGVGYNPGSDAVAGSILLQSGVLTVGSIATPGSIFVGAGTATSGGTAATSGTLVLGSGMELNLVGTGGSFYLGGQSANTSGATGATSGMLMMTAGSKLSLGSTSNRVDWFIGRKTSTGSVSSTGAFSATGGELTAFLGQLIVGQNVRGGNNENLKGVGMLNLDGLDKAAINTVNLLIGHSTASSAPAEGSMTLNDGHTLTVTGGGNSVAQIGVNAGGTGSGSHTNSSIGSLLVKSGSELMLGMSETSRSAVTIGSNASTRGSTLIANGTLNAELGSTFTGYLSSLVIGSQSGVAADKTYRGTGVMDLRLATVAAFDVSGNVTIGYHSGNGEGSVGELRLAGAAGKIGGNLYVGDKETGAGSQVSSSGLLELDGAHLEVGGNVTLGLTGKTRVTVSTVSAGLLLSSNSNLTIELQGIGVGDINSGYHITFEDPASDFEGIYYGLAWKGSQHLETVNGLVDNFSITWTNSMSGGHEVGVFYDPGLDLTYVGLQVIPEPSTMSLILASGVGLSLIFRSRRARGC